MKQETIAWADIIAETGNYRDGFVAIFRKYEGLPTDEKDAVGRAIKVTVNSFAGHLGIAERTFARWVKGSSATRANHPRSANDLGRDVKRAAVAAPSAVVDGIMAAPQETQDAILNELLDRRADALPFGGEVPKVPGEDDPTKVAVQIRSLCATSLATLGVLEVKLAEATVDDLEEVTPSLTMLAHRAGEVLAPFVPSVDTVEQWLRERSEP
jgi:hypothetical protein